MNAIEFFLMLANLLMVLYSVSKTIKHYENRKYKYAILSFFAAGFCSAVVIAMILIQIYKY